MADFDREFCDDGAAVLPRALQPAAKRQPAATVQAAKSSITERATLTVVATPSSSSSSSLSSPPFVFCSFSFLDLDDDDENDDDEEDELETWT